jgi:hypothetical protein
MAVAVPNLKHPRPLSLERSGETQQTRPSRAATKIINRDHAS